MSYQFELSRKTAGSLLLLEASGVGDFENLELGTHAPYSVAPESLGAILMGATPEVATSRNVVKIEARYSADGSGLESILKLSTPTNGVHVTVARGEYEYMTLDSQVHAIGLGVSDGLVGVSFLSEDCESFVNFHNLNMDALEFATDALRHRICGKISSVCSNTELF